jgi:CRISPR/Cas system-associated endonuclease Cas1
VGIFRVEQAGIEPGFVAEEKESFRIGIESTERINVFGKAKLSQGAVG